MNRKTATACAAAVAALTMTACSANQASAGHQYEARGVVDAKQIDYDCKGGAESLDMDPVAYTRGRGGGSSSRGGSSGGKSTGSSSKGSSPKGETKPDLHKKPGEKPEGSAKQPGHHAPQQCRTEYELFIRSNGDLFEQDVTQEHYERCDAREKFPECIK